MNESRRKYETSCHTCGRVVSHRCMSAVAHVGASCHILQWVTSYIYTSHVAHMNESYHTYKPIRVNDMTALHSYGISSLCQVHESMRAMTHSYMWGTYMHTYIQRETMQTRDSFGLCQVGLFIDAMTHSYVWGTYIHTENDCGYAERWGAGVETHFEEISWNLRPVVNGT